VSEPERGTRGALLVTLLVGGAIAVALSFVASRVYDAVSESEGVAGLDLPILQAMMRLRTPVLDLLVTGYTDIAGPIGMPILAVVAILILSLRRRSWIPAILIASAGVGSLLMTISGKDIIGRVRPPLADAVPPYEYSPSFPSGHTLNAVVIAGVVAYLVILRRQTTKGRVIPVVVAGVFTLTIGLSRVYLGHHWFTDVLAGWVLGGAWLALIITAHRLHSTRRLRRIQPEQLSGRTGERRRCGRRHRGVLHRIHQSCIVPSSWRRFTGRYACWYGKLAASSSWYSTPSPGFSPGCRSPSWKV
jgi:membrane-associated phospholipid phosphatase